MAHLAFSILCILLYYNILEYSQQDNSFKFLKKPWYNKAAF
jgi:hypothetical protein